MRSGEYLRVSFYHSSTLICKSNDSGPQKSICKLVVSVKSHKLNNVRTDSPAKRLGERRVFQMTITGRRET